MSANILSAQQVAEKILLLGGMTAYDIYANAGLYMDSDGPPPSPIELWAGHFVDRRIWDDDVISELLRLRRDSTTTLFEKSLEALLSKQYDKKYAALEARMKLPLTEGIPSGAETVTSIGYDYAGQASILNSYGERVKRVDLESRASTTRIVGIAASWMLTIQQARGAAMSGIDIDSKGLKAANRVIAVKLDDILSLGYEPANIFGFINLPTGAGNIHRFVAGVGGFVGHWHDTATVEEIISDVAMMRRQIKQSKAFSPTHLEVDSETYARIIHLRIGPDTETTVDEFLSKKFKLTIEEWDRLDNAAVGGGPRTIMYEKSDEVASYVISQEPEFLPSVWSGLGWETIIHSRCGGVRVEGPQGIVYGDLEAD